MRQICLRLWAARMEDAARRRVERARHLALDGDGAPIARWPMRGIDSSRAVRVGMRRGARTGSSRGAELDDAAEIEHRDPVGEMVTTARSWLMNR